VITRLTSAASRSSPSFEDEELEEAEAGLDDIHARFNSLRRQLADAEAEVAQLRRDKAIAAAVPGWKEHSSGGLSPRFRWKHMRSSPADVIATLTGWPNAEVFDALHDYLNAKGGLDSMVMYNASKFRAAAAASSGAAGAAPDSSTSPSPRVPAVLAGASAP
jgi:hypothetical protein